MIKVHKLGVLCDIGSGGTPLRSNTAYYGGEIPWVKISDLETASGVVFNTDEKLTLAGLAAIRGRLFPAGTLLFAIYGSIGKMAFAGRELSTNQAILGLQVKTQDVLEPRYLFHWLANQKSKLEADGQGIAQKNLSAAYLRGLEIALPSVAKQKEIVELLDKATALRAKRQATLAQLDELTQSVFLDMFSNPASKDWSTTNIAGIANPAKDSIRTGPFGSQLLHGEFTDSGIAVLGIDNVVANEFHWGDRRFISEEKYRQLKRYTVRPGDVLISIMGTCGRCAVVPDDIPLAINTKHLCCITLDRSKCLPAFLHAYFLQHPIARRFLAQTAKGAIMSGLNMGLIQEMPIPLPPMDLQLEFKRKMELSAEMKTAMLKSLAEFDSLFASLQHRAFRGEL